MSHNRNALIEDIFADQLEQVNQQIMKNNPEELQSDGDQTVITSIPPEGYQIIQPGKYVFGNTVNWTPSSPYFSTAIIISCENVVLDLQGYSLIAEGEYKTTSLGIIVLNGINSSNHVTIKNGTISNMGLCGLWGVNTSNLSLSQITVEGLTYPDFDFLPAGISLYMANSFNLDQCTVKDVNLTAMLGAGILLMECKQGGTVNNCTVKDFTNNDGVAGGFVYFKCDGIQTSNSQASTLQTIYGGNPLSKIGHTCIGFMPTKSNNLTFDGCTATGMTGCCDDCHGMSLFLVDTVTVTGFTASGVHDGEGPKKTGAKATGLEVYGNNVRVKNSQVNNITAIVPQDLQSTGFSTCGDNITFEGCTANNVQVLNADKQPDISYGYGTGFGWAPDPRIVDPAVNATYRNCIADNCQLGFDTWNHHNSQWINPQATGCGKTHLNQPSGAERVYSMNFCSELPNSEPSSPSQQFTITNTAENNTYPGQ